MAVLFWNGTQTVMVVLFWNGGSSLQPNIQQELPLSHRNIQKCSLSKHCLSGKEKKLPPQVRKGDVSGLKRKSVRFVSTFQGPL
jgi:hypothetical protein